MSGPINQIFYDALRMGSFSQNPNESSKVQTLSSGPKELGEFMADVVSSLRRAHEFSLTSTDYDNLNKYFVAE
ncbi:4056_t:CDS:1, partial [Diversispora eburnea]